MEGVCVCLRENERMREGNSFPASKENAKKGDEMKAIFSFSKRKGVGISIVQQVITHTTKQNLTERTNIVGMMMMMMTCLMSLLIASSMFFL